MHTPLRTPTFVHDVPSNFIVQWDAIRSFDSSEMCFFLSSRFCYAFALLFSFLVDDTQSVAPVSLSIFLPFCDCARRAEAYGINEWASERMFAFTICHGSFSLWLFVYYISLAFCKCEAAWVSACFFFFLVLSLSFTFLSLFLRLVVPSRL